MKIVEFNKHKTCLILETYDMANAKSILDNGILANVDVVKNMRPSVDAWSTIIVGEKVDIKTAIDVYFNHSNFNKYSGSVFYYYPLLDVYAIKTLDTSGFMINELYVILKFNE